MLVRNYDTCIDGQYSHGRQDKEWQAVYAFVVQIVAVRKEKEVEEDGDDCIQQARSVKDKCHQILLLPQLRPFVVLNGLDVGFDLFQLFPSRWLRLKAFSRTAIDV